MRGRSLAIVVAAALAACADFRKPSDLRHAQILAVRSSRPRVPPGERATIDLLVTGDDGVPRETAPDRLEVAPDPRDPGRPIPPAVAALVGREAGGWTVTVPSEAELAIARGALGLPPDALIVLPLQATIALGVETRIAQKAIVLGAAAANPIILRLLADGAPIPPEGLRVPIGGERRLGVEATGAGTLSYAWYGGAGDLDAYRTVAPRLSAPKPGSGALLVVVRDDRGGVAWLGTTLTIE